MHSTTRVHTWKILNQIKVYVTYKTRNLSEAKRNVQFAKYASLQPISDHSTKQPIYESKIFSNEYLTALLDKLKKNSSTTDTSKTQRTYKCLSRILGYYSYCQGEKYCK
jgi:hypothetical protein